MTMFKYRIRNILLLLLVVLACSCASTIKVREANTTVPEQYRGQSIDTVNSALVNWKNFFSDVHLIALIDTALVNNQELNIFLQQMAVAKNEIKARKGEYLPFLNFGASAEVEKVGEFTRKGAIEKNLPVRESEAFPEPLSNYTLGLTASWELDVWKKLRNSKKAAVMDYLATVEGKNFMVTNLVAEIADAYYELVALDNQLAIIEQNLEIQQNALHIVRLQKQAARATELAVKRFEAEVLKNISGKYGIKQQIIETENRINFLLGRQPSQIDRASGNFMESVVDALSAGIPAQLLSNRPDIRKAEFELGAAKLDVKVARANFYPSFGLKAGVGLEAFKPKFLTSTPESLLYSLAGDVVGPLINRNAIKAEYNSSNVRQLQAVFEYEKTILNAYLEVVNGLSNIENLKKNYEFKNQQVDALTKSIEISNKLFQSARADYMEVLLTQRDALESKIELVETKKEQLKARVVVFRALGGGWK
ncbi:TolC family protein [Flagellimonas sp. CMM7]|uniref:TolC family protein n=1 Tax=Flagellimonas sp. CMM7 TaxID=2654676 RepID=UPI0013D4B6F5|nr:TolC family protein [Flagellimonas sp. CMM7]UII78600.1 TolC family protein [Flagellimonas sp. CMM7]